VIVVRILLLILLHIGVVVGLLGVPLGLGGNFILLALALATAWIGHFAHLSLGLWFVFLALAVLGEIVESVLGVVAARGFGATRWGMLGTFAGGILGAVVGTAWIPVLGSLVGAFAGAFLGAFAGEILGGSRTGPSFRAGTGAFLGRVAATAFKMGVGGVIAWFTLKAGYALV
jgi:hypothetical protein